MEMASELPLPADLQALVASYAAYSGPTPSAAALQEYLLAYPWIEDIIAACPVIHPGTILLHAPDLGLIDCSKCSQCAYACHYRIRRRYEADEEEEEEAP